MTATEDKLAEDVREVDQAKLSEWRAASLDTLPEPEPGMAALPSTTMKALASNGVTTRGRAFDLLHYEKEAGCTKLMTPPFNLSDTQANDLADALDKSLTENGLDPAAVIDQPDTPTIVEADPAALAGYDQETARLVAERETFVSELEAVWEDKHADAAVAKKEFEKEQDSLRKLIRDRRDSRGKKDLFTGVTDATVTDPARPDPLADLWQQYPIEADRWERWGLTGKDVEKLNAGETKNHGTHPMMTLGDVTRFITPDPKNPAFARTLKDIKGIGDKGMERYVEAETKFWDWWGKGGKEEFATEKGISSAYTPGAGAGDGPQGGDGDTATGTLPGLEDAARDTNPLPDATAEPKKRKGRGKAA